MVKIKNSVNKLSDKLCIKIRDYINDFSLPRQFFKFEQDEIPENISSKMFNKIIPIEEFQNNFYSIAHRLCIEMKLFEDDYFISELDKASKIENEINTPFISLRQAIVEAKVKIDRWDRLTTSTLINYMNLKDLKRSLMTDLVVRGENNPKYCVYGSELIFDLNVPINYIYSISNSKNNYCGYVIWENFGTALTEDEKNIEIFNKLAIVIDQPKHISRASYKIQD